MGVVVRWSFGAGVFLCVHGRRAGVRVDEREWAGAAAAAAAAIDGAVRRVRTDNCGARVLRLSRRLIIKRALTTGIFLLPFGEQV